MAIPKNVEIPKASGQFMKLQDGSNRLRFLSDVITGWEGWKDNKPFRHKGDVCKIKPEDVDLNKNTKKPNINYFWAMIVWNYTEKKVQVLEITQKTIMGKLYNYEQDSEWGDLKGYDIDIIKGKKDNKVNYDVIAKPAKEVAPEIKAEYENTEIDLEKLFEGDYPINYSEGEAEDIPFDEIEALQQ